MTRQSSGVTCVIAVLVGLRCWLIHNIHCFLPEVLASVAAKTQMLCHRNHQPNNEGVPEIQKDRNIMEYPKKSLDLLKMIMFVWFGPYSIYWYTHLMKSLLCCSTTLTQPRHLAVGICPWLNTRSLSGHHEGHEDEGETCWFMINKEHVPTNRKQRLPCHILWPDHSMLLCFFVFRSSIFKAISSDSSRHLPVLER